LLNPRLSFLSRTEIHPDEICFYFLPIKAYLRKQSKIRKITTTDATDYVHIPGEDAGATGCFAGREDEAGVLT